MQTISPFLFNNSGGVALPHNQPPPPPYALVESPPQCGVGNKRSPCSVGGATHQPHWDCPFVRVKLLLSRINFVYDPHTRHESSDI
jgi:hypothetical protein